MSENRTLNELFRMKRVEYEKILENLDMNNKLIPNNVFDEEKFLLYGMLDVKSCLKIGLSLC